MVAIEPFVTVSNAVGKVRNAEETTIFKYMKHKSLKNPHASRLIDYIEKNFRTLPFSERWLKGVVPPEFHRVAFQNLLRSKCLMAYHVFVEASGKPVAQAEHTVLISKNGCEVLTR